MTRKKSGNKPGGPNSPESLPGILNKPGSRAYPRARFVLILSLSCAAIYALINAVPASWIKPVNEHTAWTLGQALHLMGMEVLVKGEMVSGEGFSVKVIPECTAVFSLGLYLCFLLAYPASLRKRLLGVAVGVPLIWSANLLRLILVFIAGSYDRLHLDVVHVYAGQVFNVCMVFVSCSAWLRYTTDREPCPTDISFISAGFLVRFAATSTVLFFLWLHINRSYVWLVDQAMLLTMALFGKRFIVPRDLDIYFCTFNIVVFTSLLLSTRPMTFRRRAEGFVLGLCFIFPLHVIYRTCNALVTAYQLSAFMKVAVAVSTVGCLAILLRKASTSRRGKQWVQKEKQCACFCLRSSSQKRYSPFGLFPLIPDAFFFAAKMTKSQGDQISSQGAPLVSVSE